MYLKKAFSLAELLIVISIIGIITVLGLALIRPNDSLTRIQYAKAYKLLYLASFNVFNDTVAEGVDEKIVTDPVKLCKGLRKYVNTKEIYNTEPPYDDDSTGKIQCNKMSVVSYISGPTSKSEPWFIASNGMRFYLSNSFKILPSNHADYVKESYHRIVWVDINGPKKPNTTVWKTHKPADIVAFDINDQGEVMPLGYPKLDHRYIQARVVYPTDELNKKSLPTSYMQAQKKAFGNGTFYYDSYSDNYEQTSDLFISSPLRISSLPTDTIHDSCVNAAGAEFPKCTIELEF